MTVRIVRACVLKGTCFLQLFVLIMAQFIAGQPSIKTLNPTVFGSGGLETTWVLAVVLLLAFATATDTGAIEQRPSEAPLTGTDSPVVKKGNLFSAVGSHFCGGPLAQVNPTGSSEAQKRKKRREQQIKRLGQKYLPNGNLTILKPGAIKGNRTMDNPWVVKTDHYVVKTDISRKAAGEIALIMEMFYHAFIQSPVFNVQGETHERLPVLVPKNRSEFEGVLSSLGRIPRSVRGLYMKSSKDRKMVTYYFHSKDMKLNHILLHEGTHQFIDMAMKSEVPTWLEEGLASYFEYSRFNGLELVEGGINKGRLKSLYRMIRWESRTPGKHDIVKKFSTLMRKSGHHFHGRNYAQAWSLIHFLLNSNDGKFVGKLQKYFNTYRQENVQKDPVQLFQEVFGFHPDKMYPYWKEYVFNLR